MCILLKLHYAKFDVSRSTPPPPPPIGKGRVNCVLCILVGQNTPELDAKQTFKGFIFPFAKGTPNIKVMFLFEVNFDMKHFCSGFEYDPSQIWLKFLYVFLSRPIIVKLCNYHDKEKMYQAKKNLKGTKIMIVDSLTKRRLELLKRAKETFGATNVWTLDGKIFTNKGADADGKRYLIKTADDIYKI